MFSIPFPPGINCKQLIPFFVPDCYKIAILNVLSFIVYTKDNSATGNSTTIDDVFFYTC